MGSGSDNGGTEASYLAAIARAESLALMARSIDLMESMMALSSGLAERIVLRARRHADGRQRIQHVEALVGEAQQRLAYARDQLAGVDTLGADVSVVAQSVAEAQLSMDAIAGDLRGLDAAG